MLRPWVFDVIAADGLLRQAAGPDDTDCRRRNPRMRFGTHRDKGHESDVDDVIVIARRVVRTSSRADATRDACIR